MHNTIPDVIPLCDFIFIYEHFSHSPLVTLLSGGLNSDRDPL